MKPGITARKSRESLYTRHPAASSMNPTWTRPRVPVRYWPGLACPSSMAGGAQVHGVVPGFLLQLECAHAGLTEMEIVDDMRERKHRMLTRADALVTLPGGCGTYEELFEALTLKRLGQWTGPIVLLNTRGFYDRLLDFLDHSGSERFMAEAHTKMWSVVNEPEAIPEAMTTAPRWTSDALEFANV